MHNHLLISYNNAENSTPKKCLNYRYSFKKQGTEDFWALVQSGRATEPIIPCQDGPKELWDIMLTMEKYFMLKTQSREKKSKVKVFHGLHSRPT